jgi:hypothetical protein
MRSDLPELLTAAVGGNRGYGAVRLASSVRVPLVRMHTFQVGEHYLTVKGVPVLITGVFDHSIRDSFLVFPRELGSATRTLLSETHRAKSKTGTLWA